MKENINKKKKIFIKKKKKKKKKQKMKEHTKIIISFFFLLCVVLLAWIFYGKRQPQEISNTTTRQKYVNSESIHDNEETTKETIMNFLQKIIKEGENKKDFFKIEVEELRPILIELFIRKIFLYESAIHNIRFWGEKDARLIECFERIRKILETKKKEVEKETEKIALLEANLYLMKARQYLIKFFFVIYENYGKNPE